MKEMEAKDLWSTFSGSMTSTYNQVLAFLPNLLMALLLIVIGWLIARLLSFLTGRLIDGSLPLIQKLSHSTAQPSNVLQRRIKRLAEALVFWTVLLVFAGNALQILDIELFSLWVTNAAIYLPNLIAGVVILFSGFLLGGMAQQAVSQTAESMGLRQAGLLGGIAQAITLLLAVIIGINQFGIDTSFLVNIISVVLLTVLGGLSLTVALSSRKQVSNFLAANYVRKHYQIDDYICIDQQQGRILEIGDWFIQLETAEGELTVPASQFLESACIKLMGEENREK